MLMLFILLSKEIVVLLWVQSKRRKGFYPEDRHEGFSLILVITYKSASYHSHKTIIQMFTAMKQNQMVALHLR